MTDVSKSFGGVRALADVSLEINAGEILALVGDNGAGKSTFIRIIAGLDRADSGELYYGSDQVKRTNPRLAQKYGIEVVPQHLALCDNLSAVDNMVLGMPPIRWGFRGFGWLDRKAAERMCRESVGQVGSKLPDMRAPVRRMSGGQRQAIAIGRALLRNGKLILFDEPTAALGVHQREQTLNLIRRVAQHGVATVIISHNVDDVYTVADRVVAFRQGRVVLDGPIEDTPKEHVRLAMEGLIHD